MPPNTKDDFPNLEPTSSLQVHQESTSKTGNHNTIPYNQVINNTKKHENVGEITALLAELKSLGSLCDVSSIIKHVRTLVQSLKECKSRDAQCEAFVKLSIAIGCHG